MNPKVRRLCCVVSDSLCAWCQSYGDEVAANVSGTVEDLGIGAPEVADVVELHDEDDNPVDARHDFIQAEGCRSVFVLLPNCVTMVMAMAVVGGVKRIVRSNNDNEQP